MPLLDPADETHTRTGGQLRSEPVVWLTTVRPDGQPQSSPVWFLWNGGRFLILSKPDAAKVANIRSNPRVAVHLRGDERAEEIATFEGTAALIEASASELQSFIEKYRPITDDYGWEPDQMVSEYSQAVRVEPTRARIW